MKSIILVFFLFFTLYSSAQSEQDTCTIYVPNTLTMDCSSGEDYQLKIQSSFALEEYSIEVFNRWGDILFKSKDINEIWYAVEYPDGVYVWRIKAVFENKIKFDSTGNIHLLK